MFFTNAVFMIGHIQALEGLRRGVLGTASVAAFITVSGNQASNIQPIIDQMVLIQDIAWGIFNEVPDFLKPLATGFWDYLVGMT